MQSSGVIGPGNGTPGKGWALEIYFDASDIAGAEMRIRNAVMVRERANILVNSPGSVTLVEKIRG